jgi:acyl dehydratase
MKLPAGLVGAGVGPRVTTIDARWLMAYAAALGETDAAYFDTRRDGGILAHPLFPVCYEWPLALEMRAQLPEAIALRSVHATHDLRLARLPRAGDRLALRATVVAVAPRRSGAYVLSRYEAIDAAGDVLSVTEYGSVYLGVQCEPQPEARRANMERQWKQPPTAEATALTSAPDAEADVEPTWSEPVTVSAGLAHVYTECARIWNPIHTDRAVAARAGLADIILHGTATLALGVSRTLHHAGAGPAAVSRITGSFRAMVPMPSTLAVEGFPAEATAEGVRLPFRARVTGGRPAIRDGNVWLRP